MHGAQYCTTVSDMSNPAAKSGSHIEVYSNFTDKVEAISEHIRSLVSDLPHLQVQLQSIKDVPHLRSSYIKLIIQRTRYIKTSIDGLNDSGEWSDRSGSSQIDDLRTRLREAVKSYWSWMDSIYADEDEGRTKITGTQNEWHKLLQEHGMISFVMEEPRNDPEENVVGGMDSVGSGTDQLKCVDSGKWNWVSASFAAMVLASVIFMITR